MGQWDDMVETVLARAGGSSALRSVGWQQLVELLARSGEQTGALMDRAYRSLSLWRTEVSAERWLKAREALAGAAVPSRLLEHIGQGEEPAPTAPSGVPAAEGSAVAIPPATGGPGQHLLQDRALRSAAAGESTDVSEPGGPAVLNDKPAAGPAPASARAGASTSAIPIRELVNRIDRFRRDRSATAPAPPPRAAPVATRDQFAFEATCEGVVSWTDAPMESLFLGMSLTEAAGTGVGADHRTAALVARRLPVVEGRLKNADQAFTDDVWTLDAQPIFSPDGGRFEGYAGHARIGVAGAGGAATRLHGVQHLMHELKTPLNAVSGFAEAIQVGLHGPVATDVRDDAARIHHAGRQVLNLLDGVELAARADVEPVGIGTSEVTRSLTDVVETLVGSGLPDVFDVAPGPDRIVAVPASTVSSLLDRLLTSVALASGAGERIPITITGHKRVRLRVGLPARLSALPIEDLQAFRFPSHSPGGDLPTGLEFVLQLVRRLVDRVGGAMVVTTKEFIMSLPIRE